MSPDETLCLGALYIYPGEKAGYDATAFWLVRTSALPEDFNSKLGTAVRGCLDEAWPKRVVSPVRDIRVTNGAR